MTKDHENLNIKLNLNSVITTLFGVAIIGAVTLAINILISISSKVQDNSVAIATIKADVEYLKKNGTK